jgi:hypothetical protein
VTEISQILLVLLDSRCPLLHYPPSLAAYLAAQSNRLRIILVLTKVDVSGESRADAWTEYLKRHYPNARVIRVESYARHAASQQAATGKRAHEPQLPSQFRMELVQALKDVHEELLQPPEAVRKDEEKLKRWKPSLKRDIDWELVLKARSGQVGSIIGGAVQPRPAFLSGNDGDGPQLAHGTTEASDFLTVGLIGSAVNGCFLCLLIEFAFIRAT